MSSIVCHKAGIDDRNPELGRALEHDDVCDCICELQHDRIHRQSMMFQNTGRSPGISFGCESLQPAKKNVAYFKDRLDVILEEFLLSTKAPTA